MPSLQTGVLNGEPVLRFPGNDYFVGPDCSSLTEAEVFIVVKCDAEPPANDGAAGLWSFGTSGNVVLFPYPINGNIYDDFGSTTRPARGNPTPSLAAWRLYSVKTSSSEWTNYVDGTEVSTAPIRLPFRRHPPGERRQ